MHVCIFLLEMTFYEIYLFLLISQYFEEKKCENASYLDPEQSIFHMREVINIKIFRKVNMKKCINYNINENCIYIF